MLLLSLLFAPAQAAAPGSHILPDAVYRPAGRGEAWVGGYYGPFVADSFDLGPAGVAIGVDTGTSEVCTAGLTGAGAPQGSIKQWDWMLSGYGRCSPIQLEDNVFNLGGYLFAGAAGYGNMEGDINGDWTGDWAGVGILGIAAEGGIEYVRGDVSVPVVPIVFRDPWFEAEMYKSFEAGITGQYSGHYLRIGIAKLSPTLTYKVDIEGYSIAVTGTLWEGEPGVIGRVGYQF
ncbi:MAG: hypothetical protein KC912_02715 [Proteobacteria bacterium]|nr:hypothetical protein [Pseudomonadota bacterium]